MRRVAVIGLPFLLLLALGLAAWWYWQPAPVSTSLQSMQVDNAATGPPAAAATAVHGGAGAASVPVPAPGAAARREVLQRRAEAGDMAAAAELGGALAACANYAPTTQEDVEEAVVNGFAAGTEPPQINGRPMTPALLVGLFQVSQRELAQRCEGFVDPLKYERSVMYSEDVRLALPLLQQAADSGQTSAMIDYAAYAFHGYDGAADMLRNATQVRARRDRARTYLDRAVAAGDAQALLARADARLRGGLLPPDPVAGYADLYAFAQTGAAADWPAGLTQRYLDLLAQDLDAAQLAQARERGEALWRGCCAGAQP